MNRLIIVGNGFDLAHGLPTGYCTFVNYIWHEIAEDVSKYNKLVHIGGGYNLMLKGKVNNFDDFIKALKYYEEVSRDSYKKIGWNQREQFYAIHYDSTVERYIFKFENIFFSVISKKSIQNWVDVENEYYKLLKDCIEDNDNSRVKKLNEEFQEVKNLLEEYLQNNVCNKYDFGNMQGSGALLKHFLVRPKELDIYLKEFPKKYHEKLIEYNNIIVAKNKEHTLRDYISNGFEQNLFLNFNYTPTVDKYISTFSNSGRQNIFGITSQIQIHGKLGDNDNQINFGFGDEMDDAYKKIENKDDNEYLQNIKSFKYFQNSNYKDMLDFIDTEEFQVYIMGHSCGLSDRILLNKIFEHEHCLSIKVFYYENNGKDNYTDIVQNISRHFNKKEMMREKIVNKSLCVALPQDIRFAKKQ